MHKPLLSPINDYVFKKIFGEDKEILTDFLQSVLDLPAEEYADLQIVNPILLPDAFHDKSSILDLKIYTASGKIIDVEIQINKHIGFLSRVQYYLAKLYAEQLKEGDEYSELNKTVCVIIVNFAIFADQHCYHCFRFLDRETHLEYPDSIEMDFLELPKLKQTTQQQKYYTWMKFLSCKSETEFMELAQNHPAVQKAFGLLKKLSADDEERLLAEAQEKDRRDRNFLYHSGLKEGQKRGLQKGLKQGLEQGKRAGIEQNRYAVVTNMLKNQFPLEMIANILGLSVVDVEKIITQINTQ